jgi:ribosomal-protein-alanine N-acetyltransferase
MTSNTRHFSHPSPTSNFLNPLYLPVQNTPMLNVNLHPFPVINTPRLTMRALSLADAEAAFAMRSDPEVMKYIDRPPAKSIDEAISWINLIYDLYQKNEGVLWALSLHGNHNMIGSIGIWQIDKVNHRAEIGYMLSTQHQGKGYLQEALIEAIKYAFEGIGLHSIEANLNPANQASIKLLERTGFVREAYFKQNYYYNGKFLDSAIYSLITTK